jgi:hypothetical protein
MESPGKSVTGPQSQAAAGRQKEIVMKGNRARSFYTDAYMNDEGYSDPTAGMAIERLYREQMRKKRAEETRILMERSGKRTIHRTTGHSHDE